MIYKGNGVFHIETGDWIEIVIWSDQNNTVSAWENPIFSSKVARWFLERHIPKDSIRITTRDEATPYKIIISDPNVALEFRLRWCEPRPGHLPLMRGRWVCCAEQNLYVRRG